MKCFFVDKPDLRDCAHTNCLISKTALYFKGVIKIFIYMINHKKQAESELVQSQLGLVRWE